MWFKRYPYVPPKKKTSGQKHVTNSKKKSKTKKK